MPLPGRCRKFSWLPRPSDGIETSKRRSKRSLGTISRNHSGWENNDGAYGTFVFDVPDRTITLEHNERYTEVDTTTHEF